MTPHEEAWLALALVDGVGGKTAAGLTAHFGDVTAVLEAGSERLMHEVGLAPGLAGRIARARETSAFRVERRLVEQHGVTVVPLDAERYPARLREIPHPPALLYCRGERPLPAGPALAVVGTRSTTRYGEKATRRLIEEAAAREPALVVVSGLARGIDTVAHEQALACGLRTVAVMGGGLADVYPPENRGLAERIVAEGALISEFPMTRRPRAQQFPVRNRVIAGLATGVLVVEAGRKSGALITAGFAQTYDRPVCAVPGNIDLPSFAGTNHLIQTGQALLADSGEVLLAALAPGARPRPEQLDGLAPEPAPGPAPGAPPVVEGERGRVLASLARGPLHPDDLAEEVLIPIEKLIGLLLELELAGEVVQTADHHYALA